MTSAAISSPVRASGASPSFPTASRYDSRISDPNAGRMRFSAVQTYVLYTSARPALPLSASANLANEWALGGPL